MTANDFRYSKIGYVALNVSDVDRSEAFYGPDVVGLAPTGRLANGASCFRCSEDHHNEIDDIGAALGRFHRHDVSLVWGPGRHPASGQMFLYFSDPDGITVEYSFGGEEFPAENPRPPQMLALTLENIDYWGAPMLRPIGEVGHVEQL